MLGQELLAPPEKQPKHTAGEGGNHFPPGTSIATDHQEVIVKGNFRQKCGAWFTRTCRAPVTLLHAFSATNNFSNVVQRIIIAITVV